MRRSFYSNSTSSVIIRFDKRNAFSLAVIQSALALRGIEVDFSSQPRDGIMIYSLATPQSCEVYHEVANSSTESVFIAGGPHPSAKAAEALKYFDFVVIGEGEETLPELILTLANGGDPSGVRGIAFKRSGAVCVTRRRPYVKLDEYPPFKANLRAPIEISRGCPYSCKYCQTPRLFGKKMRHRSVEAIASYSKYLSDVRFVSPNAFAYGSDGHYATPESIAELLTSLHGRVYFGTFPSEVRPEFVTDELLDVVKERCENTSIHIGAQSGSDAVLDETKRAHSREDVEAAVDTCVSHGFCPVVDFIFGLPTEVASDQIDSLSLIDSIVSQGGRVRAHYFIPLPGTPYENETPTPLIDAVPKRLGKLARDGKISGRWEAQGTSNKKINDLK
jgi:B12-binding domain/radical SAM domain protein